MELSQYGELFLSESREHLSAINHLLLALEADPGSREGVEGVFRAVHTIKGMSATMGYGGVADLAHEMENLLDRIRQGRVAAGGDTVDLLFAAADALERAIDVAVSDTEEAVEFGPLLRQLRAAAAAPGDAPAADEGSGDAGPAAFPAAGEEDDDGEAVEGVLRVRLEVSRDSALPGVRAFLAVRRARDLGEVSELEPSEAAMQEPGFAGSLRFLLRTGREADEVRGAFGAVGELAVVSVAQHRVATAMADDGSSAPQNGDARPDGQAPRARNIRVDLRRLDALMNGVGELVIVRDRLRRLSAGTAPDLAEAVDQASRLIGELQGEIMRARMAPVWQVFDRFPRLVRDAARLLDKRVEFVIEGKEIELDRSMLDEIGDPLVHLLRNSLDHGIEPPAERRAKGKPEAGTLTLTAARERSRIIIRVEDDGRGIQREGVLRKAISTGLIAAGEAEGMSDEEVYRLLTRPGFSTAEKITDVSGRGVGLDVVATRVRALGGLLEIQSTPGEGTAFTLQLPQTLAIVRALLVRLGDETYALPLTHVGETVHLDPAEIGTVKGRPVAMLRDEVMPLLSLRAVLSQGSSGAASAASPSGPPSADANARSGASASGSGSNGTAANGALSNGRRAAVILEVGEQRIGLEVDRLLGQQEIVVKSFDGTTGMLRVFSGATILSDGRPALILDAGSVVAGAD
ncbi:MAG TPA: chemotaxis protein CheA [Longimicrobiaceae bacterium]|jgi:two-component system chemotaxis sensor kinase CheA|nr:chemotaxis protein CheA [Longimicrobiaceae bacterium]